MVISMEVLGDHQIYSHFAFTGRTKNNFKENPGWFESAKIPDIWENQMVESMLMEMGESKKELSDMKYYSPEVNI